MLPHRYIVLSSCALWHLAMGLPGSVQPRANFVHPGILIDEAQAELIRTKVSQSAAPWAPAYTSMLAHPYASKTAPEPVSTVECGSYSTPDVGCSDEREDAMVTYLNALAWTVTGTQTYANKAITFMDSWASTIKAHNNTNSPLQSGWVASTWARAAELIRYSDAGWSAASITKFEGMLRNVYLPLVKNGAPNYMGNWDLVMAEAAIFIGVFLDDQTIYDAGMTKFLNRVPAYVYLESDGDLPKTAPGDTTTSTQAGIVTYWQGQSVFNVSGLSQETCRDFEHTGYGLASIGHVAETSRIQGRDLFNEETGTRLRYALEFHSKYHLGEPKPTWLCPGKTLSLYFGPVTEVSFRALSGRLGYDMPYTEELTLNQRPAGTNKLFVGWETLTNA
ncbi:hypothetical protein D7B24_003848 [Verticillium nonalfalfae]|uniref:Alginate lyase domain-containing protein n=1 Tax=Verticillium nonalfalfae TaxID=1051616 RepID=A0A3M9XZP2_9PEZI|nr:uncharacterized protein D7B24_003848 [Verticillium nonalfalfae]RNJ52350.1 hypothetical protein D7B24_003848 [Verticillium nonalfalfae]